MLDAGALESQGFYDRLNSGFGRVLTPEDVAASNALGVEDLLREMPGVLPVRMAMAGTIVRFRSRSAGMLHGSPNVYIDGIRVPPGIPIAADPAAGVRLDDHINFVIEAVEAYVGPAETPLPVGRDRVVLRRARGMCEALN